MSRSSRQSPVVRFAAGVLAAAALLGLLLVGTAQASTPIPSSTSVEPKLVTNTDGHLAVYWDRGTASQLFTLHTCTNYYLKVYGGAAGSTVRDVWNGLLVGTCGANNASTTPLTMPLAALSLTDATPPKYWCITDGTSNVAGCGDYSLLSRRSPSSCDSFVDVQGSAVGTTVTLSWKWKGETPPGGWKVYVPDFGSASLRPSVPSAVVGPTPTAQGRYGGAFTVVGTPTSFVVESAADNTCYAAYLLDGVGDGSSSVNYGDDDDGTSCGLNPFCYVRAALRWAFVPPEDAGTRWSSNVDSVQDAFPVNVIAGSWEVIDWMRSGVQCTDDEWCDANETNPPVKSDLPFVAPAHTSTGGEVAADLFLGARAARDNGAASMLRTFCALAVWFGAAWAIWHRIARSFGGKAG